MGSVKDLQVTERPTAGKMGVGRFHFSDRYSVFDWGEMPDHIDRKGEALCLMGAYCFELLKNRGVETHYRGLVDKNGRIAVFEELEEPTSTMEVHLVNVYKPKVRVYQGKVEYDYSRYTSNLRNCLIPLEIIYRNGLPEGSSVFKRLDEGKVNLRDLGLEHRPHPSERLAKPLFDVSTKLEETDRYITWEEAKKIAGLTSQEVAAVKVILSKVNDAISGIASNVGLENEDGKIELALNNERRLMIVDVVGTLDECRFTYNGVHVSKEVARQFYKQTSWYSDLEKAKRTAETHRAKDWKALCKSKPPKLDPNLKSIISYMYMAATNEITGRKLFDAPRLAEVIKKYREYIGEQK
jgi:phosphoribosylaminoimidazole-succinocarboxamide synthase